MLPAIPITQLTLYKHGVGFFQRRAKLIGDTVKLTFHVDAMNDMLKSLTVLDYAGGQVLGIEFATPQTLEERLNGCTVRVTPGTSLRDLLASLRGRSVRLVLAQADEVRGLLLGLDAEAKNKDFDQVLVSVLAETTEQVRVVSLGQVQSVELLDPQSAQDLRFFLATNLEQEDYRQVVVRLTPGEHDLAVAYVAPAPTWRVSYRLVLAEASADKAAAVANQEQPAWLLGWGIFHNQLEEDLDAIALTLVAGAPNSFVYDLYTPVTPERPEIDGEEVAEEVAGAGYAGPPMLARSMVLSDAKAMPPPRPMAAAMAESVAVQVEGEHLDRLFEYHIATPVTVGRSQSAMVPIVAAELTCMKVLFFSSQGSGEQPVAAVKLHNKARAPLERGPITVLAGDRYLGEAMLPFTVEGDEIMLAYAAEQGMRVRSHSDSRRALHQVTIRGALMQFEEWDSLHSTYTIDNKLEEAQELLLEHRRSQGYEIFETPTPTEQKDEWARFLLQVPAQGSLKLRVQERRLRTRTAQIQDQTYANLQEYLKQGLLASGVYERVAAILAVRDRIAEHKRTLEELTRERQVVYATQEQIRKNLAALATTGKEGEIRARYVDDLAASEKRLAGLATREADAQQQLTAAQAELDQKLQAVK